MLMTSHVHVKCIKCFAYDLVMELVGAKGAKNNIFRIAAAKKRKFVPILSCKMEIDGPRSQKKF